MKFQSFVFAKKNKPSLAFKIEIAQKWIAKGHSVTRVLRIVGVSRSTYYFHLNYVPKPHSGGPGRSIPGYSYTEGQEKVSDEQIKEWIMEAVAGDEAGYGYHKLLIYFAKIIVWKSTRKRFIDYVKSSKSLSNNEK